ncbi:hypothetical protein ACMGDK_06735 [Chryseobacterium sp. DT-3]|uniref:hypothetical protein n=1 Tax=Chryseobacterium sp. DT-3 TaxID=3396164 RepID=UPI003F1DF6F7
MASCKRFIRTDDKIEEKDLHQQIIYRHFVLLTTLRCQLRENKKKATQIIALQSAPLRKS